MRAASVQDGADEDARERCSDSVASNGLSRPPVLSSGWTLPTPSWFSSAMVASNSTRTSAERCLSTFSARIGCWWDFSLRDRFPRATSRKTLQMRVRTRVLRARHRHATSGKTLKKKVSATLQLSVARENTFAAESVAAKPSDCLDAKTRRRCGKCSASSAYSVTVRFRLGYFLVLVLVLRQAHTHP